MTPEFMGPRRASETPSRGVALVPETGPFDPDLARDRLDRRVQVVAGKGGVGRTLIASALALRAARAGYRTLLLEVDAPDSAAHQLEVKPAVDEPREVLDHLWLCRMTPAGAMKEYALMILRFKALYQFVFENRLVKYLLRSIPSLGEFTMLGKAWFHATDTLDDGRPRYERVIIDAPATGHAVTFLSLARLVAEVSPKGVMKDAAEKMADVVESTSDTCVHLVTLPEEMPVNEGLELLAALRDEVKMTPGLGVVNRVQPKLLRPEDRAVLQELDDADPVLQPYLRSARAAQEREAWQIAHVERFVRESGLVTLQLAELGDDAHGRAGVEVVIAWLDAVAARAAEASG